MNSGEHAAYQEPGILRRFFNLLAWAGFVEEQLRLGQLVPLTKTPRRHADAFYLVTRRKTTPTEQMVAQALLDSVTAP